MNPKSEKYIASQHIAKLNFTALMMFLLIFLFDNITREVEAVRDEIQVKFNPNSKIIIFKKSIVFVRYRGIYHANLGGKWTSGKN